MLRISPTRVRRIRGGGQSLLPDPMGLVDAVNKKREPLRNKPHAYLTRPKGQPTDPR